MKCLVICVCDGDGGSSLLNLFYTFKTNRPSEEELDYIYNELTKRALEAQGKLYEEAYPFHDVGGYEDMDEIAFGTNDTSDNR